MVNFKFEGAPKDNLTWDDLEILESGKMGASKGVLARFVVGGDGNYLPFDEANKTLGKLKLSEIEGVLKQFMEILTGDALNPTTAAKS